MRWNSKIVISIHKHALQKIEKQKKDSSTTQIEGFELLDRIIWTELGEQIW